MAGAGVSRDSAEAGGRGQAPLGWRRSDAHSHRAASAACRHHQRQLLAGAPSAASVTTRAWPRLVLAAPAMRELLWCEPVPMTCFVVTHFLFMTVVISDMDVLCIIIAVHTRLTQLMSRPGKTTEPQCLPLTPIHDAEGSGRASTGRCGFGAAPAPCTVSVVCCNPQCRFHIQEVLACITHRAVAAIQPLPYFVAAASEDVEMAACQDRFLWGSSLSQHCRLHPTFGVACGVEVAQQLYCLLRTEAAAPVPRLHMLLRFLAACPARSQHPLINGCWPCMHAVLPWD